MKVVVIGGGAAGMMAAITSAKEGNKVTPAKLSAIKEGLPIINKNT